MRHERLLVVDECIDKRLASQLCQRDRAAISVYSTPYVGVEDSELLPGLADLYRDHDWVLVTGDDAMPGDHGDVIQSMRVTVATVDGRRDAEYATDHSWRSDVIHRWAHAMQEQPEATVRRYGLGSHEEWKPRRRRPRRRP